MSARGARRAGGALSLVFFAVVGFSSFAYHCKLIRLNTSS